MPMRVQENIESAFDKQELFETKNQFIRIPFSIEKYQEIIGNPLLFREHLEQHFNECPELFPYGFHCGYVMKDIRKSEKLNFSIRRIVSKFDGKVFTIHPSFIMPGCSGFTEITSKGLFLRKFGVPFWAIAHTFGHNAMYWYRQESSLGRYSLVETTVKDKSKMPEHIAGDEKHSKISGEKTFIATTVAKECILGCELTRDAGNDSLEKGYGVFKKEASKVDTNYSPTTVNLDGWNATNNAWASLYKTIIIIPCILHFYIKLRDRSKRKFPEAFILVADRLWNCYKAGTKSSFSQRLRRFSEWSRVTELPEFMSKRIEKLQKKSSKHSKAYDFPGCHRTSNMLDRLMQRMDRHLFASQYFHGDFRSANFSVRGWALIHNFAPYNPYTVKNKNLRSSPAEVLNENSYADNWLENLLVSTSLVTRYRMAPPKPL
jgi:hypothetical protein